jgi:hypothetical protein
VGDLKVRGDANGVVTLSKDGVNLGGFAKGTYAEYNSCLIQVIQLIAAPVSTTGTRSAQLKLVDTYVDDERLVNIKIKNDGNGDAFIYEVRLLLYRGEGMATMCLPAIFTLLEFPFSVNTGSASITMASAKKIRFRII